ncbi:unnamed protein product, partial [Mesorhabditis spiculigera]
MSDIDDDIVDQADEAALFDIALANSRITAENEQRARAIEAWKKEFPLLADHTIRSFIHLDDAALRLKFRELTQIMEGKRGTEVVKKPNRPPRLAVPVNLNIDFDAIHREQLIEALWAEIARRKKFLSGQPHKKRTSTEEWALAFFLRDSFVTIKQTAINRLMQEDFYLAILMLALIGLGLGDRLVKKKMIPAEIFVGGLQDIMNSEKEIERRNKEANSVPRAPLPEFADQMWNNYLELQNFNYKQEMMNIIRFDCPVCLETWNRYDGIHCSASEVDNDDPEFCHLFCETCVRQHTRSSMAEMQLADGVGVRCMQQNCNGHITLPRLLLLLDEHEQAALNKQLTDVALLNADRRDILQCSKCDYAFVNIDMSDCQDVLRCRNADCLFNQCRHCPRPYDARHAGRTCAELTNAQEAARKRAEEELTALIVRRCPTCPRQFVKADGCNWMTCECGASQCYLCNQSPITQGHFGAREQGLCNQFEDAHQRDELRRQARIQAAKQDELIRDQADSWL